MYYVVLSIILQKLKSEYPKSFILCSVVEADRFEIMVMDNDNLSLNIQCDACMVRDPSFSIPGNGSHRNRSKSLISESTRTTMLP